MKKHKWSFPNSSFTFGGTRYACSGAYGRNRAMTLFLPYLAHNYKLVLTQSLKGGDHQDKSQNDPKLKECGQSNWTLAHYFYHSCIPGGDDALVQPTATSKAGRGSRAY